MKRSIGPRPALLQPVYLLSTYDEKGQPDLMPVSWGGLVGQRHVELVLENDHQSLDNLRTQKAFTLSWPSSRQADIIDYCGLVSLFLEPDKMDRAGWKMLPARQVYAPYPDQALAVLECEVESIEKDEYGFRIRGRVVDALIEDKLNDGLLYDPISNQYYGLSQPVGQAFASGFSKMKQSNKEK